jgi:hypothetical protein
VTTRYLVALQFTEGGPAVTGEWNDDAPALRTYRGWVGLYGSQDSVVIRLIEVSDGREHVLKTWTAQGEVDTPPRANP